MNLTSTLQSETKLVDVRGFEPADPLLAKRGTKFTKSCRSRRNTLRSDKLGQTGTSAFSHCSSPFVCDLARFRHDLYYEFTTLRTPAFETGDHGLEAYVLIGMTM